MTKGTDLEKNKMANSLPEMHVEINDVRIPTEAFPTATRGIFSSMLTFHLALFHSTFVGKYFKLLPLLPVLVHKMIVEEGFHTFLTKCESLYGYSIKSTGSEVCAHIPFQLKTNRYHVNVTTESGGVDQFQGTGCRRRRVSKLAK